MAPTLIIPTEKRTVKPKKSARKPPKPKPMPPPSPLVCFSFAAYAKSIIHRLKSLNVAVSPGLADHEISAIESALCFSFPPDLRSILQVGLPVGSHFPNWRVASTQHLRVLLNLPILCLSKNVTRNGFWVASWGPRPQNDDAAWTIVKKLMEEAPVLVPVYGNCYIPSTMPNLAGNPVFYVDGDGVRVLSFDVTGFFQRSDRFSHNACSFDRFNDGDDDQEARNLPAWAATEARGVDFWSEVAERGSGDGASGNTRGWWSVVGDEELSVCLDCAFQNLRDGGWSEDDVREMMTMMDGPDERHVAHTFSAVNSSLVLLHAGWSMEDVVYALDLGQDQESNGRDSNDTNNGTVIEASSCESPHRNLIASCSVEEDHQKRSNMKTLMYLLSLEA